MTKQLAVAKLISNLISMQVTNWRYLIMKCKHENFSHIYLLNWEDFSHQPGTKWKEKKKNLYNPLSVFVHNLILFNLVLNTGTTYVKT